MYFWKVLEQSSSARLRQREIEEGRVLEMI